MKKKFYIDFSNSAVDNYLWSSFVESIGVYKAKIAIRQSMDLQQMQGNSFTIPVLITDTCGTLLANIKQFQIQTGLNCSNNGFGNIIIYSSTSRSFQLLISN